MQKSVFVDLALALLLLLAMTAAVEVTPRARILAAVNQILEVVAQDGFGKLEESERHLSDSAFVREINAKGSKQSQPKPAPSPKPTAPPAKKPNPPKPAAPSGQQGSGYKPDWGTSVESHPDYTQGAGTRDVPEKKDKTGGDKFPSSDRPLDWRRKHSS